MCVDKALMRVAPPVANQLWQSLERGCRKARHGACGPAEMSSKAGYGGGRDKTHKVNSPAATRQGIRGREEKATRSVTRSNIPLNVYVG